MKRIVEPEWLDTLPPADPRAERSRQDLRRVNWWMRNHVIMARALRSHLPQSPRHITELGAGDGNFLLQVVRKFWTGQVFSRFDRLPATAILLDRQKNISVKTRRAFAELGWRAEPVVTDVFDWKSAGDAPQIVVANLFLHHFEGARLSELLGQVARNAKLFVAVEPQRFRLASLVGKLLWFIGCNDVTRHDAAISIRAGFADREISALWPDSENWELTECRAGWFSHLFIARRRC
jgi:hypothetical protein